MISSRSNSQFRTVSEVYVIVIDSVLSSVHDLESDVATFSQKMKLILDLIAMINELSEDNLRGTLVSTKYTTLFTNQIFWCPHVFYNNYGTTVHSLTISTYQSSFSHLHVGPLPFCVSLYSETTSSTPSLLFDSSRVDCSSRTTSTPESHSLYFQSTNHSIQSTKE